jgi:cob(I)alamin adenosyltransferase
MEKGLLIVFTGDGKGKTTAALGLAMRSCGHRMRVCMIQFVKGKWKSGETDAARRFEDLMEIHTLGKGFVKTEKDIERHRKGAKQAWEFTKEILKSSKYRVVILDELTYLIKYKMIDEDEVVETLARKPEDLHIIVTGRKAPQSLIDAADLVTEMCDIKHPHKVGVRAQQGIEF